MTISYRTLRLSLLTAVVFCFVSSPAFATTKQVKFYQEAYPDVEKPKCIACHTAEKPKKDANHDLNDYGKKVKALAEEPTAEEYKKAGQIPA